MRRRDSQRSKRPTYEYVWHDSKADVGFTYEEAQKMQRKVDIVTGAEYVHSKYYEAEIIPDPRGGYGIRYKRI